MTSICGEEGLAEFGSESGQGGVVDSRGFEMLLELAGLACALVEAEHAERAGEFVGDSGGFLLELGREDAGAGGRGGLFERGEAFEDSGLIALPERSNLLLRRRLNGFEHVWVQRR
jgi:hypothetical protein